MIFSNIIIKHPWKVTAKTPDHLDVELVSNFTNIEVKWPSVKKAVSYEIYRADATKKIVNWIYEKDINKDYKINYKKLKTLSSKTNCFKDKKVKPDRIYMYYVNALDSKKRILASNNEGPICAYASANLYKPIIDDTDEPENPFITTSKNIWLLVQKGAAHTQKDLGAEIYRKKSGSGKKKYRKIDDIDMDEIASEYNDTTVKGGTTYIYKARLYKKINGKKYFSKYSDPFKIGAFNHTAKYKVKSLTPAGIYINTSKLNVKFKIQSSKKYNGDLIFYPRPLKYFYAESDMREYAKREAISYGEDKFVVTYQADKNNAHSYYLDLKKYSLDGKKWNKIPQKGVALKAGQTIYLFGDINLEDDNMYSEDNKSSEKVIYYGGSSLKGGTSYLCSWSYCMSYKPAGERMTFYKFDFLRGTGEVSGAWPGQYR